MPRTMKKARRFAPAGLLRFRNPDAILTQQAAAIWRSAPDSIAV